MILHRISLCIEQLLICAFRPCLQYLLHLNASEAHIDLDTVTQQVEEAGAKVSSYIPDNTLLVVTQPEKLEALKQVAGTLVSVSKQHHISMVQACQTCYTPALTCCGMAIGVVWVGDYLEAYKVSPEAQRLVGWAPAQPNQEVQQAGSRQAAQQQSSQAAKGMHAFVRQDAHGTSVVVLDVAFPQSLSEGLQEIDHFSQPSSWSNASAALTSLFVKAQPKFHPANAALADWQGPLDVVCHSQCRLAASGPGGLTVTSPAEFLEVLLQIVLLACLGSFIAGTPMISCSTLTEA